MALRISYFHVGGDFLCEQRWHIRFRRPRLPLYLHLDMKLGLKKIQLVDQHTAYLTPKIQGFGLSFESNFKSRVLGGVLSPVFFVGMVIWFFNFGLEQKT